MLFSDKLSKLIALLIFFAFNISWAQETKPRYLGGIEFLSGFGAARLSSKKDYKVAPIFFDLDFQLKPLLSKRNINFPGLLQFVWEPFASYVSSPNKNMEAGNNFLIKIGILPETSNFQPYFKGGVGFIYITQHTQEQSTQFNFNEYAGIGMHYFLQKKIALTLEYRFRHISNADIKRPNSGIDNNFAVCGVSFIF